MIAARLGRVPTLPSKLIQGRCLQIAPSVGVETLFDELKEFAGLINEGLVDQLESS